MRRLLVLDPSGRALLCPLDGEPRRVGGQPTVAAHQVRARTAVWSAAGGWAAVSFDSDAVDWVQQVRVELPDEGGSRELVPAVTAFYLQASPCGRYLSHLSPGPLGLELGVSDVHTGELRVIERGQPLFWAWSPDSSRLALHVGDRVVVVGADGSDPQTVTESAGSFLAPWWMPDGSVLYVEDELMTRSPDGSRHRVGVGAGAGRCSLDPDGRRVALIDLDGDAAALQVVDLLTGSRHTVTRERAAGFFWSPDGRRLAVLVAAGSSTLQWLVYDGSGVERLAPFRPSPAWLREVLPFFEQYAHSHAVWSADGTELVAPAIDADGSTEALVQQVVAPFATERLPGARLVWWAP